MEGLVTRTQSPLLEVGGLPVLVTGHTGFKGSWLAEWLLYKDADVHGLALPPESDDALFVKLGLADRMNHALCDIRDADAVVQQIRRAEPVVIFHLAAQAFVRRSYRQVRETWETNVVGTINVLEAARSLKQPVTVVVVTTDKVYKNREWEYAYREEDELGGHDPYSASKAACEIAVASWRDSFGSVDGVTVVTARAGNVLGGGDCGEDRIVPDCFRAWQRAEAVELRRPRSTRPWQHVLEPLSGYLTYARHARNNPEPIPACNFGPSVDGSRTVEELVRSLAELGPDRRWSASGTSEVHEAAALSLSIDRARYRLHWRPQLSFAETVSWTNKGYMSRSIIETVRGQIDEYERRLGASAENSAGDETIDRRR